MPVAASQLAVKNCSELEVVAVQQLGKQYRNGCQALKEINLSISKGDLFGLIGPDGSGKSTLLRILAGVMEASSGSALVLGQEPRQARHLLSYVPQNCALYAELTVEENLRYQAGLFGVSENDFAKLADKLLKSMGLLKFKTRLAAYLSGGMKQKLALCCALISQPRLILLDEPSTGLDPIARRELWQALSGLREQGVTAVVATPFLDEAERCNRVALMFEGNINQTGSPQELQKALNMTRLEITLADEHKPAEIWNIVNSKHFKHINDICLYGDHLELLARDPKAASSELCDFLASAKIGVKNVFETEANMESLFVMRMRELGLKESQPPPFPLIHKTDTDDRGSQLGDTAILAQDLSKTFKDFLAVDNVQLEIKHGEIYGLLGANGAGKTTTIKMLCGLMQASSGKVSLAGISENLRSKSIRKRIGYMSQKFTLYDTLTVAENLEFYASIYEIPMKLRKQQIDWVIQACGLEHISKAVVGRLPLGWKQRIAFGAAVMHAPDIIFLDEPTAGVDPLARRLLWTLIREFALRKAAVLVTTHYMDEAEYCNRLAFMAGGKIVTQGSRREIMSQVEAQVFEIKSGNTQDAYKILCRHLQDCNLSIFGDSVHVMVENGQFDAESIRSILQASNNSVKSIRAISCSLEDVFINVVQRSLRQAN